MNNSLFDGTEPIEGIKDESSVRKRPSLLRDAGCGRLTRDLSSVSLFCLVGDFPGRKPSCALSSSIQYPPPPWRWHMNQWLLIPGWTRLGQADEQGSPVLPACSACPATGLVRLQTALGTHHVSEPGSSTRAAPAAPASPGSVWEMQRLRPAPNLPKPHLRVATTCREFWQVTGANFHQMVNFYCVSLLPSGDWASFGRPPQATLQHLPTGQDHISSPSPR